MRNCNREMKENARWQSSLSRRGFTAAMLFSLRILPGCLSRKSQAAGEAELVAKAAPAAREQQEGLAEGLAEAQPGVLAAGRPRIPTTQIRFIRNRGPSFRNSRHRRQQISRFLPRLLTEPAGSRSLTLTICWEALRRSGANKTSSTFWAMCRNNRGREVATR